MNFGGRAAVSRDEGRGTMTPQVDRVYVIELCSGELRRWSFLGLDRRETAWWRDEETGRTFSEASLMYVWKIVAEA